MTIIFFSRIVKPSSFKKPIEKLTLDKGETKDEPASAAHLKRLKIAKRASLEFKDGMYCNLGIGMPTYASNFIKPGIQIYLQSENGLLGMGNHFYFLRRTI